MSYSIKRLHTQKEFEVYSHKLQSFEKQFTYPLADKCFIISHGDKNNNYFNFFKRLGKVSYFVIEKNQELIGAGCAILVARIINGKKETYWYLGDFKINKQHRGKNILQKITFKYFLTHYLKSNKMIAINMSPSERNGLVKVVGKIFSWFNVTAKPLYFFEWDKTSFEKVISLKYIQENYVLFTNNNLKDIIIEDNKLPLYHLVNKQYAEDNFNGLFQYIDQNMITNLEDNSSFMFATPSNKILIEFNEEGLRHSSESSFISHKIDSENCHFFFWRNLMLEIKNSKQILDLYHNKEYNVLIEKIKNKTMPDFSANILLFSMIKNNEIDLFKKITDALEEHSEHYFSQIKYSELIEKALFHNNVDFIFFILKNRIKYINKIDISNLILNTVSEQNESLLGKICKFIKDNNFSIHSSIINKAFSKAVKSNNISIINLLNNHFNVNYLGNNGCNLIHAIRYLNFYVLDLILASKGNFKNLNFKTYGYKSLFDSERYNSNIQLINLLFSNEHIKSKLIDTYPEIFRKFLVKENLNNF